MKGLFWILALFAAAVGAAMLLRADEGYALLVFPPWRIEVSLNFLIFALLFGFAVLYLLLRSIAVAAGLPGRVRAFRARRAARKSAATFQEALRLYLEGRYGQALRRAADAHEGGYADGLPALLAARAARAMREPEKEQEWVRRAREEGKDIEAACLMNEAESLLEARRFDDAVTALRRLYDKSGRHIAALRLELKAQQGRKDWDEVIRLARLLQKRNALVPELARETISLAHREALKRRAGDTRAILAYARQIPAAEMNPRTAYAVAEALRDQGAPTEALRTLETHLDKEWSSHLVRLYGLIDDGDATPRIAQAEKWLKAHSDDADLLLALGRLCQRKQLWGKAQSYLEASLSVAESRDAHLELARLFDQLERQDQANRHYRAAALPALS
ncbi:HemY protein [Oryzomicrobium terrae]|uniref:HemY protein n=1 Tax=Oryzomicrobium terrae TaxID=1735038 RepID=A0A5C1E585_9RHOO|nr:heme biosynthesis HemY N-terminal domain-containing protein [Oryzomicrobium terrae]QEL64050.1 HemY protein [Oryzomicrobium terrae]